MAVGAYVFFTLVGDVGTIEVIAQVDPDSPSDQNAICAALGYDAWYARKDDDSSHSSYKWETGGSLATIVLGEGTLISSFGVYTPPA